MSLSLDRSNVVRIQEAIGELQRKQAVESKNVADYTRKANAAMASASRPSSQASANSYLSTATRESKNAENTQGKQAGYTADIAQKTEDLIRAQERVASLEERKEPFDFFISHAWADKVDFVDELVSKAASAGLNVWYDRQALEWGDSIRQKVDDGLRRSYFGVVVLSPSFFERSWTQDELDGIVQRDLSRQGSPCPDLTPSNSRRCCQTCAVIGQ